MARTLTLTTDFGTRDAYVAAMKGTILGIAPDLSMIDVTHEIAPQDVMEAAFVLSQAVPYFPDDTVHLVVVDPGVGTERRPVALRHAGQWFVGPDNGLFALLIGSVEPEAAVVLDEPRWWRTETPSATFHGRDIFAPVAAHLASGRALSDLGSPTERLQRLQWALPIPDEQGIQGWVVHIDHFGNCITNIPESMFEERRAGRRMKCIVGSALLDTLVPSYASVAGGEPLVIVGSHGQLEIAVNQGNAAELLGIRRGARVNVMFFEDRSAPAL